MQVTSPGSSLLPTPKLSSAERTEALAGVKSDFLTAAKNERKSARLSSALIHYKRPKGLNLVPFGVKWSCDLFARLNNGVRRQVIDLYNMIDAMQKHIDKLRSRDLNQFFTWWELFQSYIQTCLQAHEYLIVEWLEPHIDHQIPDSVNNLKRADVKREMIDLFDMFNTIEKQILRRPPDEIMAKIIKGLGPMQLLIDYLESLENDLPLIVEAAFREKDARRIERRMAIYMHKKGNKDLKHMHLCIVERGMTDQELAPWRKLLPIWLRIAYRPNSNLFTNRYLHVVRKLAAE